MDAKSLLTSDLRKSNDVVDVAPVAPGDAGGLRCDVGVRSVQWLRREAEALGIDAQGVMKQDSKGGRMHLTAFVATLARKGKTIVRVMNGVGHVVSDDRRRHLPLEVSTESDGRVPSGPDGAGVHPSVGVREHELMRLLPRFDDREVETIDGELHLVAKPKGLSRAHRAMTRSVESMGEGHVVPEMRLFGRNDRGTADGFDRHGGDAESPEERGVQKPHPSLALGVRHGDPDDVLVSSVGKVEAIGFCTPPGGAREALTQRGNGRNVV